MPINMISEKRHHLGKEDIAYPAVFCDVCSNRIKDAEKAGYYYQFPEGLGTSFDVWDEVKNKDWEIDHIYPVWAFLESGVTDIRVINSLDNLQVLPKIKNRKKAYKFNPVEFVRFLMRKGILNASPQDGI